MTRARLLAEADAAELTGWMAYDRAREPSPEEHRHAHLCALICQLAGNKAARPAMFLPDRPAARRKASPELVRAKFAAFGAMIARHGGG